MSDFLDKIMDTLSDSASSAGVAGKVVRGLETAGDFARYGVSPAEKRRMTQAGEIPGQPPANLPDGSENPEATRYASGYLAQKYGHLPGLLNALGNTYAADDRDRTPAYSAAVKQAGQRGAQRATGIDSPMMSAIASLLKLSSGYGIVPGR